MIAPLAPSSKRLIVILVGGLVLIHALLFWNLRQQIRDGYPDFTIFYSAGKIVARGMAHSLYDKDLQFQVQREFTKDIKIRKAALPYNHPPFEALIFVPLSYLSYVDAYLLWDAVNLCMLFATVLILRRHISVLQSAPVGFWLMSTLAFFPIFAALLQGQDIILLLLLFSLFFVALKQRHDFWAGVWLGAGLFRFHLVIPVLLLLLIRKNWKAAMAFASVGIGLTLLALAMVGWDGLLKYPAFVLDVERSLSQGSHIVSDMPNLRGLVGLFSSDTLAFLAVAATSFVMFGLAARHWHPAWDDLDFDVGFALIVVVTLLIAYHALAHDLSLLLIPVYLTLNFVQHRRVQRNLQALLLVPVIFFTLMGPLQMVLWFRAGRFSLVAPVLLIWAVALWRASVRRAEASLTPEVA
jgi:hypothetical protein